MKQMTEIAIEVTELRAENKLLKSFNDSLIQALHKPVVGGSASASALEGEQLGNGGSAKSVCDGRWYCSLDKDTKDDNGKCNQCGLPRRA